MNFGGFRSLLGLLRPAASVASPSHFGSHVKSAAAAASSSSSSSSSSFSRFFTTGFAKGGLTAEMKSPVLTAVIGGFSAIQARFMAHISTGRKGKTALRDASRKAKRIRQRASVEGRTKRERKLGYQPFVLKGTTAKRPGYLPRVLEKDLLDSPPFISEIKFERKKGSVEAPPA